MKVNKVIYGGETLVDLTSDSVTPETLAVGITAHDQSGEQIVGTYEGEVTRITNLEKAVTHEPYATDASVAYTKDVPENALSSAELSAEISIIGGMTYKDGDTLKSAPVTEVESVGANLIPYPHQETTKTSNGVTFTDNGDGSITVNGTATADTFYRIKENLILGKGTYMFSVSPLSITSGGSYCYLYNHTYQEEIRSGTIVTVDTDISVSVYIIAKGNDTLSNITFKPMLNKGTTILPYTPYAKHTLPIPEDVRNIDGYGWGVNESVYNYIDFEKKQFVKRVGKVDMGTINYGFSGTVFYANIVGKINGLSNFLCEGYPNANVADASMPDKTITGNYTVDGYVYIKDSAYTDAETFKAAMSGVMLYYELAEPIITDISDVLTDNEIAVESGGTLTFKNEYEYAVPSNVGYYVGVEGSILPNDLVKKDELENVAQDILRQAKESGEFGGDLTHIGYVGYPADGATESDVTETILFKPAFEDASPTGNIYRSMTVTAEYVGSGHGQGLLYYFDAIELVYAAFSFTLFFHSFGSSGIMKRLKLTYKYTESDTTTPQSITAYFL